MHPLTWQPLLCRRSRKSLNNKTRHFTPRCHPSLSLSLSLDIEFYLRYKSNIRFKFVPFLLSLSSEFSTFGLSWGSWDSPPPSFGVTENPCINYYIFSHDVLCLIFVLSFGIRSSIFFTGRLRNCEEREEKPCLRQEQWISHLGSVERLIKMMFSLLLTSNSLNPQPQPLLVCVFLRSNCFYFSFMTKWEYNECIDSIMHHGISYNCGRSGYYHWIRNHMLTYGNVVPIIIELIGIKEELGIMVSLCCMRS